jgi:hypothetical protein
MITAIDHIQRAVRLDRLVRPVQTERSAPMESDMRIDAAGQPSTRQTTVEPSRAWILGLVVDADGSLSAAGPADSEWPSSAQDAAAAADHSFSPDGPSVRP